MPALPLGTGETHRKLGKLPRLHQRNVLLEKDPSNGVDNLVWLQRPGLSPIVSIGDGPINGVWQQAGTFNGDALVVSGATLARLAESGAATTLGTIGPTRVQVAASATRAIIVSGTAAYSTDGVTVTTVAMPDGSAVGSVAYLDGYFFLSVAGGQRVYFIEPGEIAPDGLAFFEAERKPDPIVTLGVLGDELWLIGSQSEEVWAPSGDPDAPVQRLSARAYQNGCANRDTLVDLNGILAWVSSDFEVIVSRGAPEAVSNPAIVEHLREADATTMRAWTYALDGHLLYVLTTDSDTLVYDFSTRLWSRFSSEDSEVWRAHLGAGLLAGDSQSGAVWRLDPQRSNDDGLTFARELSGGVEIVGVPERCNSVAMRAAVGRAPVGVSPIVEMCWSDDEGVTWSAWRPRSLGLTGQFRTPLVWRKLGMMKRPGRLFRFRMTDDAIFRLSHVTYNEAFG
jgi:hypothetical protein